MLGKLLGPDIHDLLRERRLFDLREALADIQPYDIADLIVDLEGEDRAIVFRILPRGQASDVFEKLSVDEQRRLVESLSHDQLRHIIEEMDPDDRTALLEELPARVTRKLMRLLSDEERVIARTLLAYPEESVGRLMTPHYIELRKGMNVGEALDFIRHVGMDRETVYVCFVTEPGHILRGVLGLRRLVLNPPETPVEDLMFEAPAVVHTNDDQEEAARKLQDYDLLALPVVDKENRLVGIVTVDDVIDVFEEEASEDMQVMAGVLPETEHGYLDQRLLNISWRRGIPLGGLVLGQFVAALVMGGFHAKLDHLVALAFFIPLVMATGGGMGIQTATLIVRGLSTGELKPQDFPRILGRELAISLLLGVGLGIIAMGLAYLMIINKPEWSHGAGAEGAVANLPGFIAGWSVPLRVGMTIAGSLFLVMLLSVTAGSVMPIVFQITKLDPAVMTSPFLTTTVDVIGLIIYFVVAGTLLGI